MVVKNYSLSIIRLFALLLIISCHILQGLDSKLALWANLGVQLFFFLSGYLYGKKKIKDTKDFYIKRIKKVLIPYDVICIIALLLGTFILDYKYSMIHIIGCLLGFGGIIGNVSIISHTWFVTYILLCYLLLPILQKVFNEKTFKKNFINFISIVLFLQLLQFYDVVMIDVCWINNFIFGYFYSKCCNNKKENKTYEIFMYVITILIMPFAFIYQENIGINLPSILDTYSVAITLYGHVFLGTVIFILLNKLLSKFNFKENFILRFSDKYSYYVYLVHQIFILNSFSVLHLTEYTIINVILILILSILSAIILKIVTDFIIKVFEKLYISSKRIISR